MRQDVRRNIEALLSAAADLVAEGRSLSMTDIANRAGIAPSTAWRHFSSVGDLMRAYTLEKVEDLRRRVAEAAEGREDLLHLTLGCWVTIVLEGSPALIEFRSRRGYLERLYDGDEVIVLASSVWRPAVEQLLDDMNTSRAAAEIALLLTNALTDPREIKDLHDSAYLGTDEIVRKLEHVIRGALAGWAAR